MLDVDPHRQKALELANQHSHNQSGNPVSPSEIVERATAYHAFLTGGTATGTTTAVTTAPKADAKAAGKGATTKPKTDAKATTTAPKADAKAATTTAPKADAAVKTNEPGFPDLNAALVALVSADPKGKESGKAAAYSIIKNAGGGAAAARDVKPPLYGAVIAACAAQVAAWAQSAPAAPAAAAAGPAFDGPAANADEAGDPPEGGSGDAGF
jgi:hypothetical protein